MGYFRITEMGYVFFIPLFIMLKLTIRILDAVVTRGAAGRVAHQLNNLVFLDHFLEFTDVMIIHHTGNLHFGISFLSLTRFVAFNRLFS